MPNNIKQELGSTHSQMFVPKGCESCHQTGYGGRISIIEMLMVTDEIRKLILEHADASSLANAAMQQGMRTMYQDGLQKVAQGMTSLEEILRVTQDA